MVFVGFDWASTAHAVCVLDPSGTVRWRGSVPHSADGLAELVRRLRQFGPPATVHVAIERPSGVVIDTLMDAGFQVVPVHPNVVKASRSRYSAAHAKSDDGDGYLLADLLRTDGHRFRPLQPLADETRALRALVRGRDDLVTQRVALANQLRALLERFWPGAAVIFADVDSPIALAFLTRYPTPQSAECLGERRLAQFLHRHAYCGRRPAAELLARLRGARSAARARRNATPVANSFAAWWRSSSPSSPRSSNSRWRSPRPWPPILTARSFKASPEVARSMPPSSWPSSAMIAAASRPRSSWPPRPVPPPSPAPPASTAPSCSAGRATSACAKP